jgi:AcrR family transcriptional regulator
MAHEVVKRVGRRAYRYRVESYRDPATKKVRARWTYVGPVAAAGEPTNVAPKRRAPGQTRERLIDAFERLVECGPFAGVSAGAIAAEAGLAHGTFYRYFKDKRAVLVAALDRVRDEVERGAPTFEPPYGSREEERARVRAYAQALGRKVASRTGVLRAYLEALETDAELQARRSERRGERTRALRVYLEALAALAIIPPVEAESLATALVVLVDAMFRESVAEASATAATLAAGVVEAFDRAIFAAESRATRTSASGV